MKGSQMDNDEIAVIDELIFEVTDAEVDDSPVDAEHDAEVLEVLGLELEEIDQRRRLVFPAEYQAHPSIGSIREIELVVVGTRGERGVRDLWYLGHDERVGPYHLPNQPNIVVWAMLDRNKQPLQQWPHNTFMRQCGDWHRVTVNGEFDQSYFLRVEFLSFTTVGSINAQRC